MDISLQNSINSEFVISNNKTTYDWTKTYFQGNYQLMKGHLNLQIFCGDLIQTHTFVYNEFRIIFLISKDNKLMSSFSYMM